MTQFVVACSAPSEYLELSFADGRGPLDYLSERIEALRGLLVSNGVTVHPTVLFALPVGRTVRLTPFATESATVAIGSDGAAELFRAVDRGLVGSTVEIVWIDLDAPFFRVDLAYYLIRLHRSNWCDYTFGDGFPTGYAVQVLRRDILEPLALLAESRSIEWTRSALFDSLSVDINAFDVETEAAHEDWALMRANLTVETRADALFCRAIVERGLAIHEERDLPDPDSERFPDDTDPLLIALREEPAIRRTVPRYYLVQITERMTQRPSWTPWADERWAPPEKPRSMAVEEWRNLLERIVAATPEATVSIGYRGEPAEHPDFEGILAVVRDYPGITVYIETDGTRWSSSAVANAIDTPNLRAVIVALDAVGEGGAPAARDDGYARAVDLIDTLSARRANLVYVQATRMEENEEQLPAFYKRWHETDGVTPLIEKYNSWAGRLPDRRPADLTPLVRPPCVHLERDLVVLVDGTVPKCHQDLDRSTVRGNILQEGVEAVWKAGATDFADHCEQRYVKLCDTCDEYYTFNI